MNTTPLDLLPLWAVFLLTIAVVLAAVECGYLIGGYRRRAAEGEKESSVGAMVGATLGLLAFMLAFTFGLAASRFDARRMVILEEANAIGTAYLRAGMLSAPQDNEIRRLLGEYVAVRVAAAETGNVAEAVARSGELHLQLWAQAEVAAEMDTHSIITGLFIESLNDVIDLHSKRMLINVRSRIPVVIWGVLYAVATLGVGSIGYQEGLSGSRRSLAVGGLVLAFSAVMLLIADLDRPLDGMLSVSQQSMIDLQDFFNASKP